MKKDPDYGSLIPFCITEKETAYIKSLSGGMSQAQASIEHHVARATISDTVYRVRLRRQKQQSGQSTLYNESGSPSATWVKGQAQKGQRSVQDIIHDTTSAFNEKVKLRSVNTKAPKVKNKDLLSCICIGDAHLGMLSFEEEATEDFDLKKGCIDLTLAADRILDATPDTHECLIVQLGDFYHINTDNFTPQNKNPLDADLRFSKIIKSGIYVLRYFIDKALTKHKIVRVRNVAGNHDPHSHVALSCALSNFYESNKRVIIEDSPRAMFYHRFGNNLIAITHGHMPRPDKLAGVIAVDRSDKDWECKYKYCWHGHIHTKRVFESMTVIVESFRTLAPADNWTTSSGYRSGREIQAIVLDRNYGEVERHTAGIRRVRHEKGL